jgi:hypothetical protein
MLRGLDPVETRLGDNVLVEVSLSVPFFTADTFLQYRPDWWNE